ncbi:MAG: M28 family peptidase [Candidatus Binatia bacterium]
MTPIQVMIGVLGIAVMAGVVACVWPVQLEAQDRQEQRHVAVQAIDPFSLPAQEREKPPVVEEKQSPERPRLRETDLPEEEPVSPQTEPQEVPRFVEPVEEQPPAEPTVPSEAMEIQTSPAVPEVPEETRPPRFTAPDETPEILPKEAVQDAPVSPAAPDTEILPTEEQEEYSPAAPLSPEQIQEGLPPSHPPLPSPHEGAGETQPAAAKEEERLLANVRQVTFVGQRAGEGYFSQDGSLFVFQSERMADNPFYQIYLLDMQTGDLRRVSSGKGKTTCPWIHPSKKKVLFASTHLDPRTTEKQQAELAERTSGQERRYSWDFDEQYDIFESDLGGGQLKNLTKARGYDAEGSWSPDGSLIVFASNRHAYTEQLSAEEQAEFARDPSSQLDIYVMNADGSQVRRLTTSPGYDGGPFFSADGQRICWRRFSRDGRTAEIFTMNVDGADVQQLTHLGAMSWGPYFHPSGDYLIFASNLEGMKNFELYVVDASGVKTPVRVTFTDGFDGLPVFSPDGKTLAWSTGRGPQKRPQIFFAEWNDAVARQLLGLAPVMTTVEENETPKSPVGLAADMLPINAKSMQIHLAALASEKMAGRLTGTAGEQRATEYVASLFQWLGLVPAGDNNTFFQQFSFTAGVSVGENNRFIVRSATDDQEYAVDQDWRPLASSKTGTFDSAGVVFAGYGIVAPAADGHGAYDVYTDLDVTDKWVMVLRYLPEDISPELRQHLNRYASLRYKTMVARDKGARGVIVVSGPKAQVKEQLVRLAFDATLATSSIGAISVSDAVAEHLLQPSGKTLREVQDALDSGDVVPGFLLSDLELEVTIDMVQETRTGRNVLARLQAGINPAPSAVVIGAHVDHLGRGEGTGSLAREEERGQIHYGADDNASGVAGLLQIAQVLTEAKAKGDLSLQRDILFATWSGEELGLLGSSHFVRTFGGATEPTVLTPGVVAYLNMDMIGRLNSAVILQGISSSTSWPRDIERLAAPLGLAVKLQPDSYLPTDATSFYLKGVPIVSAFTGAHADYHTPRDTPDKINAEGAATIARFMAALTRSLATRSDLPDYVAATQPPRTVGRVAVRAYLGTIPDYTPSDMSGVKLSGVIKGGPAEQAGVTGGDVIIALAGRKIENIYDYTYALDALKVGVPVELRIVRDGHAQIVKVVPGLRE